MTKRKTGAKNKRTHRSDKAYPDPEQIAARLKIARPASIGVQVEGRFAREDWIESHSDLALQQAKHGRAAPSALSHLLQACLGISAACLPR